MENNPNRPDPSPERSPKIDRHILRYIFISLAILVLFAFALANFGTVVSVLGKALSLLSPVVIGAVAAYLTNMLMKPLERLWDKLFAKKQRKLFKKARRPVCLILSILIVVGVVFAVVFMMIPGLQESYRTLMDNLPAYGKKITGWWNALVKFAARWNISLESKMIDPAAVANKIKAFLTESGSRLLSVTWSATASIVGVAVNVFLGLVFSVYMLAQKETVCFHVKRLLGVILPKRWQPRFYEILDMSDRAFSSYFSGQVVEAVILGVLCCIGMLLFRMPYAGVISVVIGFTALIPIFGAWFGGGVGFLLVLLAEPSKAIWFVVFLVVLQQLEEILIYPRVVGKSVGLPGLLVLIAVTVGGSAFGLVGMICSVPVCSVLYALYQQYFRRKDAETEKLEEETEAEKTGEETEEVTQ